MDSLIISAARALAAGDVIGTLKRVALRDDPPALALRGIAMARLGDLDRAKHLLRRAARGFGSNEAVARARCVVAEAEIALVSRDLGWPAQALQAARTTLELKGDRVNAAHARHIEGRRLLLIGRVDEAERTLAASDHTLPPALCAAHELVVAGIAIRRLEARRARAALLRAAQAARNAKIQALVAEVDTAFRLLTAPAARAVQRGKTRMVLLEEVEDVLGSTAVVVDACRHVVRDQNHIASLASRPVLFALARALGEAWPGEVARDMLIARVFRGKFVDETQRAKLRVEIGRLREALRPFADVKATNLGFVLRPRHDGDVIVLVPPVEERHAAVLALLSDGEAWPSSALALAMGASVRTVQRALDSLAATGKVQPIGRGRALRWMSPAVPGFPTTLLLPGPLPSDLG